MAIPKSVNYTINKLHIGRNWILSLTPWVAIGAIASSPAQAATFAFSEGLLEFENFSHSSYLTDVITDSNTLTIASEEGSVNAIGEATANFWDIPNSAPFANLFSSSLVQGTGSDYIGKSQSQAQIMGNFLIGDFESFSFDFNAFLTLLTVGDDTSYGNPHASGHVSFGLFDTGQWDQIQLLDYVNLSGQVSSLGNNNFITYQDSDSVQATDSIFTQFGPTQNFAQGSAMGSLNRYFETSSHLTLVAITHQEADITTVPESTATFALVLLGIGFCIKNKHRQAQK
ncbi:MAG: hypothetical protein ACRC8Y_03805 [Chroococcales cyanobacterium]